MARRWEKPKAVHLEAFVGSGTVVFMTTIRHGRGHRYIAVEAQPEEIICIAAALVATRGTACEHRYKTPEGLRNEYHVGHAIWHVRNPEHPMPCIDSDKIIDMAALPEGEDES